MQSVGVVVNCENVVNEGAVTESTIVYVVVRDVRSAGLLSVVVANIAGVQLSMVVIRNSFESMQVPSTESEQILILTVMSYPVVKSKEMRPVDESPVN